MCPPANHELDNMLVILVDNDDCCCYIVVVVLSVVLMLYKPPRLATTPFVVVVELFRVVLASKAKFASFKSTFELAPLALIKYGLSNDDYY